MFKKIISQLSLSPATVERLGEYAKEVRQQQHLMGWAAIILWCLVTASIFVFVLPLSLSSSQTTNDLVPGGLSSPDAVISAYDNNVDGFRDTASLLSIERSDLQTIDSCKSPDGLHYITGKNSYASTPQERIYQLPNAELVYIRDTPTLPSHATGWCGEAGATDFMISAADGNIYTSALPAEPAVEHGLIRTHTLNHTEGARTLTWNLSLANRSAAPVTEDVSFSVGDMNEYATITSISSDGILSNTDHHILWPNVELAPDQELTLPVTAVFDTPVDETAQQAHNPHSYDCRIATTFGNTISADVPCSLTKQIETFFHSLPSTSSLISFFVFLGLAIITSGAYFCLRLQTKELRLIRTHLNTGEF